MKKGKRQSVVAESAVSTVLAASGLVGDMRLEEEEDEHLECPIGSLDN